MQPFLQEKLVLNPGQTNISLKLNEDLALRNLIIELHSVEGNSLKNFATYFSATLRVLILENLGELKVTKDDQPLPLAYVKVYSRTKLGQVTFFKDGYTDLRGRFDYGQLSGKDISQVERFAILV